MNKYLNIFALLLYGLCGCINASKYETFGKDESYKKYFQEQKEIYEELEKLDIPGARPLDIDENLAESLLKTCPQKINTIVSCIQEKIFNSSNKSVLLHGLSERDQINVAQAIAIKSQTPCLFFNTGPLAIEHMNLGMQNLNRIFEFASNLEKKLGKPCIIIFYELEPFQFKDISGSYPENNMIRRLWNKIDNFCDDQIMVISTANNIYELPTQMLDRSNDIKLSWPNLQERETLLSCHLNKLPQKYNVAYAPDVTAKLLAERTKKFTPTDLESLVEEASYSAILASASSKNSPKIITNDSFLSEIKKVKLEKRREMLKKLFKMCRCNPETAVMVMLLASTGFFAHTMLTSQKISLDIQKENFNAYKSLLQKYLDLQKQHINLQSELNNFQKKN